MIVGGAGGWMIVGGAGGWIFVGDAGGNGGPCGVGIEAVYDGCVDAGMGGGYRIGVDGAE